VVLLRVSRPEAGDSSLIFFKNFKKDYDSECAIVKFEMLVVVHDPSFTLNARPLGVESIADQLKRMPNVDSTSTPQPSPQGSLLFSRSRLGVCKELLGNVE
jgi:hypothetical protein